MTPREEPRLTEAEETIVRALHHAATTERAPVQLRERLERQRLDRERPQAGARSGLPALGARAWSGAAAALVAVAVAVVLLIPGGAGSPSIASAAALAARGSTLPAPAADPTASYRLTAMVENLHFPNWQEQHRGWDAVGARTDRLGNRDVKTVYYRRDHQTIAYSIVSSPELASTGASWFKQHGRTVFTWRESGHTCLLSGKGMTPSALQNLVVSTETHVT